MEAILDWMPYIAMGLFIGGFFLVMGAVSTVQRRRRMALAMVEDCGLCGAEIANAKAVCDACDWDPALRLDAEVGPVYEAYQALTRAIDDSNTAVLHHASAQQIGMLPGRHARAHAAEAQDAGYRADIDSIDAVEQALAAMPELRPHVDGVTDPLTAASQLRNVLRERLRRTASDRAG